MIFVKIVTLQTLASIIHIGEAPYTHTIPCDVPCQRGKTPGGILRNVYLPDIDAHIILSMEGEQYYKQLVVPDKAQRDKARRYIGSTRLDSDVPMPYFYWSWTRFIDPIPQGKNIWSQNWIQTPPPDFEDAAPRALFVASNCNPRNDRTEVVKQLHRYGVPVDSPGRCLRNMEFPKNLHQNKGDMMRQYRVYLAFENQNVDDYITEKLWGALAAGVIPVYYGAPNAELRVPKGSTIIIQDYRSLLDVASEIIRVLNSKEAYMRYHEWRKKPLEWEFVQMWNFTHTHSECRLCQFVNQNLIKQLS